MAISARFS